LAHYWFVKICLVVVHATRYKLVSYNLNYLNVFKTIFE